MTIQVWSIERNLTGNLTYTKNDTIDISTWVDGTYYEMSEIAILIDDIYSKIHLAISDHAQEHTLCFSTAVLDNCTVTDY